MPCTLKGSGPFAGQTITGGSFSAVDAATGKILWQTPDPQGATAVPGDEWVLGTVRGQAERVRDGQRLA